jgi:hypothetical protein
LHDEQTTNGLKKIPWASVFRFDVSISFYHNVSMSMSPRFRNFKNRTADNANFCFFLQMENGNGKPPFVAANGNGKRTFVFFGWQMINGNQRLLLQQMRPSMHFK